MTDIIKASTVPSAARDLKGLDFFPGIDPVDALGKGEHAGTTKPIEYLLAAPLVGDQTSMPQHRQVARGGRSRASSRRGQLAGTHRAMAQGMDNGHPARMTECLEYLGLTLEGRPRQLG